MALDALFQERERDAAAIDNMQVESAAGSVAVMAAALEKKPQRKQLHQQKKQKRVTFVGAEYIEYMIAAAPVVRLCGVGGATEARPEADVALEWRARSCGAGGVDEEEGDHDDNDDDVRMAEDDEHETKPESSGTNATTDVETLRQQLESEYAKEMRETIAARGFPILDESDVALRIQFRVSELLVAWSIIGTYEDDALRSITRSLDAKRKHLELCRKEVFGPVVDGYAFGRRFFSIDSFLSMLELEELVALAASHAIDVPPLPKELLASVKVADRELISTFSPTGLGKPLKMLTFRELVEEAYARGILMDDVRDAKQKKSKRAWVDALRPALHAEMRAFKIREAHTDLIHEHLASALETKMRVVRMETIVASVKSYFEQTTNDISSTEANQDQQAMHRYFVALIAWHNAQQQQQQQQQEQEKQQERSPCIPSASSLPATPGTAAA